MSASYSLAGALGSTPDVWSEPNVTGFQRGKVTRKTLFHGYIESLLFLPIYSRWPHLLVNHSPLGKADSLDAGCWDNRSRCRIRRDRPSFSTGRPGLFYWGLFAGAGGF